MEDRNHEAIRKFALGVTRWVGSPQSIAAHTAVFASSFAAVYAGVLPFDRMLLVLTTVVSLEAIYLSIFIQMSLNYTAQSLEEVEHDLDEIQEDIGEIQEDVDEIQEDVGEIQEDVDELQEDVEEISEEEKADTKRHKGQEQTLELISDGLRKLAEEVERLKQQQ